jgi:hypothetical protein
LPRAALAEFASGRGYPALIAVAQRFAAFDWIEFGWGDAEFYRSVPTPGDLSSGLRCAPCSRREMRSVLHVVRTRRRPRAGFTSADLVRVPLSLRRL